MNSWIKDSNFFKWNKVVTDIVVQTNAILGGKNLVQSEPYPNTHWKWKISVDNRIIARLRRRLKANILRVNINQRYTKKANISVQRSGFSKNGDWGKPVDYFDVDISNPNSIYNIAKLLVAVV